MKHLKLFENLDNDGGFWTYDNYLRIHKIKHGANSGKIRIIISRDNGEIWSKYSMMYGTTLILDTKYVSIPEIRNITLGPMKFRKVQSNTITLILYNFLEHIGYDDSDLFLFFLKSEIEKIFSNKIKDIPLKANNLGEVFDSLKILRNEISDYLQPHYDQWKLEKSVDKYNL